MGQQHQCEKDRREVPVVPVVRPNSALACNELLHSTFSCWSYLYLRNRAESSVAARMTRTWHFESIQIFRLRAVFIRGYACSSAFLIVVLRR